MGFTGQLGTSQSQLGNIVLGSLPSGGVGVANFLSHVLDSRTVRVLFDRPMDASALTAAAYTITPVGGPFYVPVIASVAFYDSAQRSVVLTLAQSLTYGGTYTLGVLGVLAVDGSVPTGATFNFSATVPDPPRAIGAYLSLRGELDVVFDRPVGQYSTGATASIKDASSPATAPLTLVPWTSAVPANNVRFSLPLSIPSALAYVIVFSGVQDVSTNSAPGTAPLTLLLSSAPPYSVASIKQLQIIDAYVDRLSNDFLNVAYLRVFFNCPVNGLLATNPANWSVTQQGDHLLTDTVNAVSLPNPVTSGDLVAYANALRAALNGHDVQPGVHVVDDNAPVFGGDAARLANDLKRQFNSHMGSLIEHVQRDLIDVVTAPDATDEPSLIVLANALRLAYNAHRTQAGVHFANETEYVVLRPQATSLQSAGLLLDEIRSKFAMHDSNPGVHLTAGLFQPSVAFCAPAVVYEVVADVQNAAGLLNEVQAKFLDHAADGVVHTYPDTVNVAALLPPSSLPGILVSNPTYLTNAIAYAVSLKSAMNGHLAASWPAPVSQVNNYATSSAAFDVTSPRTWFCDVVVPATSPVPSYSVTATLTSEDGLSNMVGTAAVRPLSAPGSVLSSTYAPSGVLTVRTDREVLVRGASDFSVTGPSGPVRIVSVRAGATTQSLFTILTDLMNAYMNHLTAAGHPLTDTVDVVLSGDFPTPSLASVIGQANHFKRVFNLHASSGFYHNFASPAPVGLADATDAQSAMELIRAMRDAFVAHNANLGLHSFSGPVEVAAKASDEILMEVDGAVDGSVYAVRGAGSSVVRNLAGPDVVRPFSLSVSFTGISQVPYLASAIPQVGLLPTSTPSDPSAAPPIRIGSDAVICFLSRSMREADAEPANVRVTGGILIKDAEWLDSRVLSVHVTNMGTTSYQIDVSGFTDRQGNPLPAFTLPGP